MNAQEGYEPAPENLEAREWFQDAKFGMFVHWGVYSVMAGGGELGIAEWIMERKKIPIKQYENLPNFFNPVEFDPKEWVSMVKDAGMKYITITSKHHDGFAMYDSEVSDYNIVDSTPYGKDVLKMLKEECDRQGIKLFFYYSQLDWHHPDYYPRGRTGTGYTGRPDHGNWDAYIDYMNAQLRELLTNYGEIGGFWFDGMWDKPDADWRLDETYAMIHDLQPQALIGSNHHVTPYPGEDFQMFEKDLPGQNTAGFNTTEISQLPLESAQTMNGSWGYNIKDTNYKSTKELVHFLVRAAGANANLLLNTGPMPNGNIQPENVKTFREMGDWMDEYGDTIYGTRGGPVPPRDWGATTHKNGNVYVHILDYRDAQLFLPDFGKQIDRAYRFGSGEEVNTRTVDGGTLIEVPESDDEEWDNIVVLEIS
ncbi:MAG: alpha-L-fucosidase [Balneolaceae bacterium]|nr:alpha-L-fucosidase [Balneolaceae bacterium]